MIDYGLAAALLGDITTGEKLQYVKRECHDRQ